MTAVSDTSPINHLVLIELQHLLPALFGRVLIPGAVFAELRSSGAPQRIASFLESAVEWLECREVSEVPAELRQLGAGEREAIALAESVGAELVLLDERKARRSARERGLVVSGTLGVLDLAAGRGLIETQEALDRLARTTFRASPKLLDRLRRDHLGEKS